MKKRLMLVAVVIVAVTASAAAYYKLRDGEAPPAVTTAAVTRGDLVESVDATGTLEAVKTVQVGTQISGTIKALFADFNDRVHRGQVIAQLEPSLFQTQVEQARATLARLEADVERARAQADDARAKLKRAQELSEQQLIARSDLETVATTSRQADAALASAQAQVTQARASLNQSQVTLGQTVIKSPIDGLVISRNVDVGQTVAASMSAPTLFVIAQDLTQMRVNANVDESDIGRIQAGQNVTFRVDAYPNDAFTGRVSQVRLQPVTEQNVVSYVTVIDVPNRELKLKPGMTANVSIEVARAEDVLIVPTSALRFQPNADAVGSSGSTQGRSSADAGMSRVWVLEDEGLKRIPVRTGLSDGTMVGVIGGALTEGAKVVTSVATSTATSATKTSPLLPRMTRTRGGSQAGARSGGARGAR
jgi:HlyD family secretion protein